MTPNQFRRIVRLMPLFAGSAAIALSVACAKTRRNTPIGKINGALKTVFPGSNINCQDKNTQDLSQRIIGATAVLGQAPSASDSLVSDAQTAISGATSSANLGVSIALAIVDSTQKNMVAVQLAGSVNNSNQNTDLQSSHPLYTAKAHCSDSACTTLLVLVTEATTPGAMPASASAPQPAASADSTDDTDAQASGSLNQLVSDSHSAAPGAQVAGPHMAVLAFVMQTGSQPAQAAAAPAGSTVYTLAKDACSKAAKASFEQATQGIIGPAAGASPAPAASPAPDSSAAAPAPAASPAPSASPAPAASPAPSASPAPAASPAPSASPAPVASATPSASPAPTADIQPAH